MPSPSLGVKAQETALMETLYAMETALDAKKKAGVMFLRRFATWVLRGWLGP